MLECGAASNLLEQVSESGRIYGGKRKDDDSDRDTPSGRVGMKGPDPNC